MPWESEIHSLGWQMGKLKRDKGKEVNIVQRGKILRKRAMEETRSRMCQIEEEERDWSFYLSGRHCDVETSIL